jgi:nicotinamide phosphoribosyltransferase
MNIILEDSIKAAIAGGVNVVVPDNILLNTDSYKASHFLQYPRGTEYVSSYIESRGSDNDGWTETTYMGLQMFLMRYMLAPITQEMIDHADRVLTAKGQPFNREGWEHILNEHGGKLPVEIQAAPEGTVIGTSNVLVQIRNTDPLVPWLTSYLETALLRAIWFPTTVATQDMYIKKAIRDALNKTSVSNSLDVDIMFKLHDFGARGTSSKESAGIGGCAHLVHFMGTDTVEGVQYAEVYYGEPNAGFGIPAAEHSTITIWGGPSSSPGEYNAFSNSIDQFSGKGKLYAVVIDSYDDEAACEKLYALKDKIISKGGTLVARPDSGHPPTVVLKILEKLGRLFGFALNSRGFKVLPDYIRVIQGDGINHVSIGEILAKMIEAGWSADNIAFGMGGAMLQGVNRDTMQFAMKASWAFVDGSGRDVYKDPVTDKGKRSKRGVLALIQKDGKFKTIRKDVFFDHANDPQCDLLETVYRNGEILLVVTFAEIRERAALGIAA